MACPECQATRKQFMEMRRAILAFARTLNEFEDRRLAAVDAFRPAGAPSMLELRRLIEADDGVSNLDDQAFNGAHGGQPF